jgi:hypothetical protein
MNVASITLIATIHGFTCGKPGEDKPVRSEGGGATAISAVPCGGSRTLATA